MKKYIRHAVWAVHDLFGDTPDWQKRLYECAQKNQYRSFDHCIAHGADVNKPYNGHLPLNASVETPYTGAFEKLMALGADPNLPDDEFTNALFAAVKHSHTYAVAVLKGKVDMGAKDKNGLDITFAAHYICVATNVGSRATWIYESLKGYKGAPPKAPAPVPVVVTPDFDKAAGTKHRINGNDKITVTKSRRKITQTL